MNLTMISMILSPLATILIGFLWHSFLDYRAKQRMENEALKTGIQSLLRFRIIATYNDYAPKGYIPIHTLEGIDACYKAYEGLGANGVIDDLMEQLHKLPHHKRGDT